jgi:hypothetical protein
VTSTPIPQISDPRVAHARRHNIDFTTAPCTCDKPQLCNYCKGYGYVLVATGHRGNVTVEVPNPLLDGKTVKVAGTDPRLKQAQQDAEQHMMLVAALSGLNLTTGSLVTIQRALMHYRQTMDDAETSASKQGLPVISEAAATERSNAFRTLCNVNLIVERLTK